MIWKNIKIASIVPLLLSNCSQGHNQIKASSSQSKAVSEMVSLVTTEVKSFSNRHYYSVDFDNSNSGCQLEILLNDVPVARKIEINGTITSSSPINSCILGSGKQKLKIKLYPNLGKTNFTTSAKNTSPITLSISDRKNAWDDQDMTEVKIFKLPAIIVDESLTYVEKEFDFEAEVPYQFQGWSMSKNLTSIPDIERKVKDKYKEIKGLLEAKDYNAFAKIKKQKDAEMNTSFFLRPDEIKQGDVFDREAFTEKDAEVLPFDNVKVAFYGYGKLVALENISDKGSALRTKIKHVSSGGKVNEEVIKFPILLHMPQNSDKLEII